MRDQARRHALTSEIKRHNNWVKSSKQNSRAPSQASSDVARDEMLAMVNDFISSVHCVTCVREHSAYVLKLTFSAALK